MPLMQHEIIISEILKQIFDIFKTEVKTGNRIELKFSIFLKCLSESQSIMFYYRTKVWLIDDSLNKHE